MHRKAVVTIPPDQKGEETYCLILPAIYRHTHLANSILIASRQKIRPVCLQLFPGNTVMHMAVAKAAVVKLGPFFDLIILSILS